MQEGIEAAPASLRHPHPLQPPYRPTLWLAEGDIEHEPLIVIASKFAGTCDRRDATRHPIGGHDSPLAEAS